METKESRIKKSKRKWREKNKEHISKYNKKYAEEHKELHKEELKKYRELHKEELKKYKEKYKSRRKKVQKKWREDNKDLLKIKYKKNVRKNAIKRKYNLEWEEYENMLVEQDNKCEICGNEFTKTPHVDHNHSTGKVRGLLCSRCNRGLGYFEDKGFLNKAVEYLNKYDETQEREIRR